MPSEQVLAAPRRSPYIAAARPRSAQRWSIWAAQRDAGHEPCFSTERRLQCEELNCPWRGACLSLRAEWRR